MIAIVAAFLIFKPRRSPDEIAKIVADAQKLATAVTPPAPAAPPVSEARSLVAKAYPLLRGLDATREDFALAEEYCQRALKLDPNDGEVWAAYSQVNAAFAYRGWDTSPARKEQTRVMAERAIRLAPNSANARMAQAGAWAAFGINRDQREKLLRDILRDEPDHQGVLRFLAVTVLAKPNGLEECLAINERSAALPGGDPLALFNNARYLWTNEQPAKGYEVLRRALAQKTFTSGLVLKMAMEVTWRGDLAAAEATLRQIPQSALQEDRANYHAGLLRYYQRNAAAALEIWQAFPRDYYMDFVYEGPKGLLLGLAYELDHREAAAKIEWRAALQLVEMKIAAAPNKPAPYLRQAMLLACLGEKAAAGEALRTYEQLAGLKYTAEQPMPTGVARVYARLGRLDEIFAHPQDSDRSIMRISPDFEALRADPRFAALMTAAGPAAPPSADWPQDPDLKRAMKLLNSPEAIVSDVALAEDIVNTVLTARPTDAEATLAMGRVQVYYLLRGFDRSEERFATAKRYAERALALTPDDPEAMAVMATYLYRRNVELPRAQKLIRQAIALRPAEPLYYRILANVLAATPDVSDAEIIASAKITAERFPADALVQYELARHYRDAGMLAEAEHYLDVAIKLGPVANAIIARARLMLFAHGDPAGMKAILEQLPERYQGTDRAVFSRFSYALVTGQPQLGLDGLQALPEAWMIDFDYTGPTALLQGELLLLQGKTELARLRFTEALAELGRHKAILERNFATTWLETWLLMRLGRLDEARKRNDVFFPELGRPYRIGLGTNWWFNPIAQNLLLGEHAKARELMREAAGVPQGRTVLRNALRLDPRMAPFRDDPEIAALLAEPTDHAAAAPKTDDKSVAVLAFANLSDDKANEYFSDGISEELLTVLQKIPGLHVAARTSAFSFKGKTATAQEIGEKLGVALLVEGSVRKAGNTVRINARLSRAATGEQLWSESYTRDLKDVFAVQSELAETIVGQLRGQFGGSATKSEIQAEVQAAEKGGTKNVEAHELYLQGKYFLNRATLEDTARATTLLQRAVELDPNFALAWAALSGAGWFRGGYGLDRHDFDEGFALARRAADRALTIEPALVAGLVARFDLQSSIDFDWPASREALRRVQELAPNDPAVVFRAAQLAYCFGQLARADELGRQAAALDPVNPLIYTNRGYIFLALHRFDDATAAFRRVQKLSPASPWGHAGIAIALVAAGRGDEAALEAAHETNEWSRLYALSLARWAQKNRAGADQALAQFIAGNGDVAAYQIACVYAYRGEAGKVFEWLERAYRQRDPGLGWGKEDYFLQGLHADPRWAAFLRKLGVADDQLK